MFAAGRRVLSQGFAKVVSSVRSTSIILHTVVTLHQQLPRGLAGCSESKPRVTGERSDVGGGLRLQAARGCCDRRLAHIKPIACKKTHSLWRHYPVFIRLLQLDATELDL